MSIFFVLFVVSQLGQNQSYTVAAHPILDKPYIRIWRDGGIGLGTPNSFAVFTKIRTRGDLVEVRVAPDSNSHWEFVKKSDIAFQQWLKDFPMDFLLVAETTDAAHVPSLIATLLPFEVDKRIVFRSPSQRVQQVVHKEKPLWLIGASNERILPAKMLAAMGLESLASIPLDVLILGPEDSNQISKALYNEILKRKIKLILDKSGPNLVFSPTLQASASGELTL